MMTVSRRQLAREFERVREQLVSLATEHLAEVPEELRGAIIGAVADTKTASYVWVERLTDRELQEAFGALGSTLLATGATSRRELLGVIAALANQYEEPPNKEPDPKRSRSLIGGLWHKVREVLEGASPPDDPKTE